MKNYYVTLGYRFANEAHTYLENASPDGYVLIIANSESDAREIAIKNLGMEWAFIYSEADYDDTFQPLGELARFTYEDV